MNGWVGKIRLHLQLRKAFLYRHSAWESGKKKVGIHVPFGLEACEGLGLSPKRSIHRVKVGTGRDERMQQGSGPQNEVNQVPRGGRSGRSPTRGEAAAPSLRGLEGGEMENWRAGVGAVGELPGPERKGPPGRGLDESDPAEGVGI